MNILWRWCLNWALEDGGFPRNVIHTQNIHVAHNAFPLHLLSPQFLLNGFSQVTHAHWLTAASEPPSFKLASDSAMLAESTGQQLGCFRAEGEGAGPGGARLSQCFLGVKSPLRKVNELSSPWSTVTFSWSMGGECIFHTTPLRCCPRTGCSWLLSSKTKTREAHLLFNEKAHRYKHLELGSYLRNVWKDTGNLKLVTPGENRIGESERGHFCTFYTSV